MPNIIRKKSSRGSAGSKSRTAVRRAGTIDARNSAVDAAIASDLAPAAAIAVLEKSSLGADGEAPPALDVLVAGVSESANEGKVHVQLLFENGAILPLELSEEAGEALEAGLAKARHDRNA